MRKIWDLIINIGIYDELSVFETKRTRLVNTLSLISILASFAIFIWDVIVGVDPTIVLHTLLIIVLTAPVYIFNYYRYYISARYILVIVSLANVMIQTILYGWQGSGSYVLINTFVITHIIFDKKIRKLILSLLCLLTLFASKYLNDLNGPLFVIEYLDYYGFALLFISVFLAIEVFKSEQSNAENKTNALLQTIDNKNKALETQRRLVKYRNDAIKQTNQELEATQKSLQESLEDLQTFAYTVSHDLKEPLRMINSYTQLLKRRFRGKLDSETEEFMHYITDGSARMKILLDDLLKYATTANKDESLEDVALSDVFSVVIKNLEVQMKNKNADISFVPSLEELPVVFASFSQMTLLFQNILSNAFKYHKPNDSPIVNVSLETNDRFLVIKIKDHGIGIPRAAADAVFSPFKRIGDRKKYKGSGIGLAICKKIVQNHKGRIWVESELNEGATFFVALPKKISEIQPTTEASQAAN